MDDEAEVTADIDEEVRRQGLASSWEACQQDGAESLFMSSQIAHTFTYRGKMAVLSGAHVRHDHAVLSSCISMLLAVLLGCRLLQHIHLTRRPMLRQWQALIRRARLRRGWQRQGLHLRPRSGPCIVQYRLRASVPLQDSAFCITEQLTLPSQGRCIPAVSVPPEGSCMGNTTSGRLADAALAGGPS